MDAVGSLLFPLLIIGIFYLLVFRPQQQKMKAHAKMVSELRRGDQVVTSGGLIGKVTKVKEDNEIEVELSQGVKVRVVQDTIARVMSKTEPADK
ncbi:MAG: preprotein translocase subunit YajC [Pseudomonadota bacterium]